MPCGREYCKPFWGHIYTFHRQIGELRQLVGMLGRVHRHEALSTEESEALFEVVTDYTYALDTLDNYDYQRLTIGQTTKEEPFHATYLIPTIQNVLPTILWLP